MGTVVEMHILVSLSKAPGMDYWWPELCWVVAVNPEPCKTRATATVVYGGSGPDRQTRPRFPPLLLLLEVWVTETQDSQGDDCPMPHNPGYPWLPPLPPSCPPPPPLQLRNFLSLVPCASRHLVLRGSRLTLIYLPDVNTYFTP